MPLAKLLALGMAMSLGGAAAAEPALPFDHDDFPPLIDVVRGPDGPFNDARAQQGTADQRDYQPLLALIPPARNKGPAWEIYQTRWSEADERGYEAFVTAIGRSGCISIDDCLRSPANPYRDLEDETLWLGDCTDMVYVLRGYYAWKNGLPFSFQDRVIAKRPLEAGGDIRYSRFGNKVVSRYDVLHRPGRSPVDAPQLLTGLFNIVSTAMLRTHPGEDGKVFDDFYATEISREAVRPGTIAYDVYGHVSIVYDIMPDGRILMISSHPDYTVSRDTFGANILRTMPDLGGGLKKWRPIEVVGATRTAKGTYIGGRIVGAHNSQLPHFSLEQYFGTHPDETGEWQKGRFLIDDRPLPYYDWVKAKMRAPGLPIDPLAEMANATEAMCESFRARRTAVNMAVYAGVPKQPPPEKLPPNIYGTYGDWERYATPSRDARLKTQAMELRQLAQTLIRRDKEGDEGIAYVSADLPAALLDVYDRGAKSCRLTYKRTDGSMVRLNMHHAMDRLFELSFDPYHCPERRWGASGKELATCPDDADKVRWYNAQRFLRYDPDRTYDLRTDFTAAQLRSPARAKPEKGGIGRATPPDVNVLGYLKATAGAHATADSDLPVTIIKESGAVN